MGWRPWAWAWVLMMMGMQPAQAHQVLEHQARIAKVSAKEVTVQMALDPATVLHRVGAPTQPLPEFVARVASFNAEEFQALYVKVQAAMAKGMQLMGPEGKALVLSAWEWPAAKQWHDLLKAQLILSQVAPNDEGHLPQVKVSLTARSVRPVTHLQVTFPKFTWPLMVVCEPADRFGLNEQMPVAVVQF